MKTILLIEYIYYRVMKLQKRTPESNIYEMGDGKFRGIIGQSKIAIGISPSIGF